MPTKYCQFKLVGPQCGKMRKIYIEFKMHRIKLGLREKVQI